jgi:Fur family zinc uptake transcriptional regulator
MYTRKRPLRRARQMTRNQLLVLELLRKEQRAMTAYQILDALREHGFRAPVQVYRALESLMDREAAHRIESLNAFVACNHRDHGDLAGFAICDDCRTIWEFTLPEGVEITALADSKGFDIYDVMVELHGRCTHCKYDPKGR